MFSNGNLILLNPMPWSLASPCLDKLSSTSSLFGVLTLGDVTFTRDVKEVTQLLPNLMQNLLCTRMLPITLKRWREVKTTQTIISRSRLRTSPKSTIMDFLPLLEIHLESNAGKSWACLDLTELVKLPHSTWWLCNRAEPLALGTSWVVQRKILTVRPWVSKWPCVLSSTQFLENLPLMRVSTSLLQSREWTSRIVKVTRSSSSRPSSSRNSRTPLPKTWVVETNANYAALKLWFFAQRSSILTNQRLE